MQCTYIYICIYIYICHISDIIWKTRADIYIYIYMCGIYQISYGKLELEPNHIWDKLSGGLFPKRRDFLGGI